MKPLLRPILTVLVLAVVFVLIWRAAQGALDPLRAFGWSALTRPGLLYAFAMLVFQLGLAEGWYRVLDDALPDTPRAPVYRAFFLANVGKYVPGKVAFVVGRVEMARSLGCSRSVASRAFVLETLLVSAAAALISVQLVAALVVRLHAAAAIYVACAAAAVGVIAFVLARLRPRPLPEILRMPRPTRRQWGVIAGLFAFYLLLWTLYGVAGWALIVEVYSGLVYPDLLTSVSAFVAAWLSGFLSIVTPGGLGFREGALVMFLAGQLDYGQVAFIALFARLLWTLVELGLAALCLLYDVWRSGGRSLP